MLSGAGRYGPEAIQYGPTEGVPALRDWVAAEYTARGRACAPAEVLITTGSQQGLDLLTRAIVDPGDDVVVEAPSYVGALQALRGSDPRIVPVPADRDGLRTDLLEESWPRAATAPATSSRTSRTRRAARSPWIGAATWPNWPSGTAS